MTVGEIYVKLAASFANDSKVRALARYGPDAGLARDLFVQMICHCKEMLTDGFVADEQIGILVYPLDSEHGEQLAKQLASVGLIKEEPGGWLVLAYVKRNGTREDVEHLSAVRAEAGRKGGRPRRDPAGQRPDKAKRKQDAGVCSSKPNPESESESESESSETTSRPQAARRDDVERLCTRLAGAIEANGSKRPRITQRWRDAARLLLDTDKHTEAQVAKAIDWCQADEFWRGNVLSMPKLREKYDQMRLAASRARPGGRGGQPPLPPGVSPHNEHRYQR